MRKPKKSNPISAADREFFQRFYDQYKDFIFHSAIKHTPGEFDYEDIVQDAVIRLLINIPTIKEIESPQIYKYLALTVQSAVYDRLRGKINEASIPFDEETIDILLSKEDPSPDDVSRLSAKMETSKLKKELPARDWIALEGKYIQGYSQEEIGRLIGVAPDSVRTILMRARKKSLEILQRDDKKGGNEDE